MDYNIKEVLTEEQTSKLVESASESINEGCVDKIIISTDVTDKKWMDKVAKTLIATSALSTLVLTSCIFAYIRRKK